MTPLVIERRSDADIIKKKTKGLAFQRMKKTDVLFLPTIAVSTVRAVWEMSAPGLEVLVADPKIDTSPKPRSRPGSLGPLTTNRGVKNNRGSFNHRETDMSLGV